jgi:hypothetical protein
MNNNMTNTGRDIFELLKETNSVGKVIEYLRINKLFQEDKANERDIRLFDYRIYFREWEEATGISRNDIEFLPLITEGNISVDRYMDADYKDDDGEYKFIYITSSLVSDA